jgi:hypothetical protein
MIDKKVYRNVCKGIDNWLHSIANWLLAFLTRHVCGYPLPDCSRCEFRVPSKTMQMMTFCPWSNIRGLILCECKEV